MSPVDPGGTRHFELAKRCVANGHRVTVVASDISYHTSKRVIDSDGTVKKREEFDGVTILRAPSLSRLHKNFVWRMLAYLRFMISAARAGLSVREVDLVMGTSPPIFQALSAWLIAVVRRKPFLFEIRDLWPEFAIGLGVLRNPFLIRLSRWLEHFLYARATHLLVNSPAYRDYLVSAGISSSKVTLVPNGVDPAMFNPDATGERVRRQLGLDGRFVVTYAGALGLANDIPTLLQAALQLREEPGIHILLVGDGKERSALEAEAARLQLKNVTFAGVRSKQEMPEYLAASDACVAILKDIPMFRTTYPNKVFDYMAAGRPVVLAIDGVIREVVETAGAGVFVHPGDSSALAQAISDLSKSPRRRKEMGRAGREHVTLHFNRNSQASDFIRLIERLTMNVGPALPGSISKDPFVGTTGESKGRFYVSFGKRILDLSLAVIALVLLLPLIGTISLAVYIKHGPPVFYWQVRPGLRGAPFKMYKFRTMLELRGPDGRLLLDGDRLTRLGRFLRRTSLDELPELWNVLRGEMSLVGPRPLLIRYLSRYSPDQARRHEVLPGITGWAQVNGRNALDWPRKLSLDVFYVDHVSLLFDLKILLMTVAKVFRREGVLEEGGSAFAEFWGSQLSSPTGVQSYPVEQDETTLPAEHSTNVK